jgi:predicted TIM-barrel fold metal-dependent hydrolase
MRLVTPILVSILALPAAARAGEPRPPIIDMHLHAYPPGEPRFAGRAPNPVTGKPSAVTTSAEHREATLAAMKRYNIVRAALSGPLDVVQAWSAASPGMFLPGPAVDDPGEVTDLDALRAGFASGKLRVLGEIGAQYAGLTLSDPRFEPLLAMAEELNVPVGIHTGLGPPGIPYVRTGFRATLGNPALLEEVLIRHPKLRLYLMHAGWPYLAETKALLYLYPQLHADLAVIDWILPRQEFHDYLQALVRSGLADRLMFGTDAMTWPEAIGMAVEGIESATFLTAEQKRGIFHDNAARFLGLDREKPAAR